MDAIRKFLTVESDSIRLPELKAWVNRKVEVIILPTEEGTRTYRPYGLANGEFTVDQAFFEPLPEDIQNITIESGAD